MCHAFFPATTPLRSLAEMQRKWLMTAWAEMKSPGDVDHRGSSVLPIEDYFERSSNIVPRFASLGTQMPLPSEMAFIQSLCLWK